MLVNINYQLWFKVCRTARKRYQVSTNSLMVLNGMYVYSKYINNNFTRRQILYFVSYYSRPKIESYFNVLLDKGFISLAGIKLKQFQMYNITLAGVQVIEEMNKSYEDQLYIFCNKYNIEL